MTPQKPKVIKYKTPGICPLCNSENIDYLSSYFNADLLCYDMYCCECKAHWTEENIIVFNAMTNLRDKEGNEYISVQEANKLIEQEN